MPARLTLRRVGQRPVQPLGVHGVRRAEAEHALHRAVDEEERARHHVEARDDERQVVDELPLLGFERDDSLEVVRGA